MILSSALAAALARSCRRFATANLFALLIAALLAALPMTAQVVDFPTAPVLAFPPPDPTLLSANPPSKNLTLVQPEAAAFDSNGNIFVVDITSNCGHRHRWRRTFQVPLRQHHPNADRLHPESTAGRDRG